MRPALRYTRAVVVTLALGFALSGSLRAIDKPPILPLRDVKPGMTGVAYTIFSGDKVDKMDLQVLGVLPNALGPKTDIILVQLSGPLVEHSGVVAGMSGSPVYIEGKLAGAIALKLGMFTKEAIAGVMPIEQMLDIQNALPGEPPTSIPAGGNIPAKPETPQNQSTLTAGAGGIPSDASSNFLVPIETPLITSGFLPQALAKYASQLGGFALSTMAGGTEPSSPADKQIEPGDMVGMALVQGDMSLSAGCTVTAIVGDRVFVCGHPLFGSGSVQLPMVRAHVITTLASQMDSFKVLNTGGVIGTVVQDRLTAVMGRLGAGPKMIPLDIAFSTPSQEKKYHFEIIQDSKLTPVLIGLATFNGLISNTAYGEGATLQLQGSIQIKGHSDMQIENLFAPGDVPVPDGFFVASAVQGAFSQIYNNPYEQPEVEKITLHVKSIPERRIAVIDSAWSEKNEVSPGERVKIKVLLRPYRGPAFLQEVPVIIPAQAARGPLQLLVGDAEVLNRLDHPLWSSQTQLPGLEELINLQNHERRNDSLYVALLQSSPTLLVEDKQLPDVPVSAINVFDHRHSPGGATLLGESLVGEWSADMGRVVTGQQYLTITVK